MTYSFTEKKLIRKNFGKRPGVLKVPYLLKIQKESYHQFLQADTPPEQRIDQGLQAAFKTVFPIESYNGNAALEFVSYRLGIPPFDVKECQQRGLIYAAPLRALLRLVVFEKDETSGTKTVRDIKEQEVYMGEIPLMTDNGTFIINGTERVIVSQLHRSPGVFFEHDYGKTHSSGKLLFSARVIPYRGSWLDLEFDPKDYLYVRIDRRRKLPSTILLRAIGMTTQEILATFFQTDIFHLVKNEIKLDLIPNRLRGMQFEFDVKTPKGEVIIEANRRISGRHIRELEKFKLKLLTIEPSFLIGRSLAEDVIHPQTGELLAQANDLVSKDLIDKLFEAGIEQVKTVYTNDLDQGSFISDTLRLDLTRDPLEAQIEIYRMMRPGEPPTRDAAQTLFNNLFFSPDRYDLSAVGRMKFNRRVGRGSDEGPGILTKEDIVDAMKILIELKNGKGEIDDIDHLGNRRVRSVGELAENQFRRPGAGGARGQGTPVAGGIGRPDAAGTDQRQAGVGGDQGVLRLQPAFAVHGPDQPAVRDHAQAPRFGPRPRWPDARARRLRGA